MSPAARSVPTPHRFEEIVGTSAVWRDVLDRAARVVPHANAAVLLIGEPGTGKALLARAIHDTGPRGHAPFVTVHCGAIPGAELESELFGVEKGATSGSTLCQPGLFEAANGGTLYLQDVGRLPLALQGKLLRVLEERAVRRMGGTRDVAVDVRVLAATTHDLHRATERREFREDLYFRLSVIPLELPPLRARREDVLPLARHFLARFAQQHGVPEPSLTAHAERSLLTWTWPGNVRELEHVVERAVLLHQSPQLDVDDLAFDAPTRDRTSDVLPFPAELSTIARAAAARMLDLCNGNKSEAARRLGISRPRLQRLLDGRERG